MVSVEICASTIRDVAVAMEAGAHRVELCSVWSVGGITPNVVVVEAAPSVVKPAPGMWAWHTTTPPHTRHQDTGHLAMVSSPQLDT